MSLYREIVQSSTINQSTSKQMFSFGNTPRFQTSNTKGRNDNFYDLPSTRQLRSAGFGYGTKPYPAPNHYNLKTVFDKSKESGKTVGTSREKMTPGSTIGFMNKNPGPGSYTLKTTLSQQQFSMRPQTNSGFLSKIDRKNPGPGTYEKLDCMNKSGKFPISKFKTYGIPIIHPKKEDKRKGNQTPGVGTYHPRDNLGQYVLSSKGKVNYGQHFSRLRRSETYIKCQVPNPGPGTYRSPSEFGHYEKTTKQLKKQKQ